jgi:hypothetical protein
MVGLKAQWVVDANVLFPNEPEKQHRRAWHYTSVDYETDGETRGQRFMQMQNEANAYAASLQKGGFNWVAVEYIWL